MPAVLDDNIVPVVGVIPWFTMLTLIWDESIVDVVKLSTPIYKVKYTGQLLVTVNV